MVVGRRSGTSLGSHQSFKLALTVVPGTLLGTHPPIHPASIHPFGNMHPSTGQRTDTD